MFQLQMNKINQMSKEIVNQDQIHLEVKEDIGESTRKMNLHL